jgi:hypothetical protein
MRSFVRLGANHSDAQWHRADVRRCIADEGAMSFSDLVKRSTRAPFRTALSCAHDHAGVEKAEV